MSILIGDRVVLKDLQGLEVTRDVQCNFIAGWLKAASLLETKKVVNLLSIEGIYASFGVTPDEESNEAAE